MAGSGVQLTPSPAGPIVLNNQVVDQAFDLGAKGIPNPEINLFDYATQCNFYVFAEIYENVKGKRMNISSDLFFL